MRQSHENTRIILFLSICCFPMFCQFHNFLPCWGEQIITYHCKHSKAEGNWETQHYPGSIKIFADNICTWNSDCPKHKNINNSSITYLSSSIYNRYYTVEDSEKPLLQQHNNNMSAFRHQYYFI